MKRGRKREPGFFGEPLGSPAQRELEQARERVTRLENTLEEILHAALRIVAREVRR